MHELLSYLTLADASDNKGLIDAAMISGLFLLFGTGISILFDRNATKRSPRKSKAERDEDARREAADDALHETLGELRAQTAQEKANCAAATVRAERAEIEVSRLTSLINRLGYDPATGKRLEAK